MESAWLFLPVFGNTCKLYTEIASMINYIFQVKYFLYRPVINQHLYTNEEYGDIHNRMQTMKIYLSFNFAHFCIVLIIWTAL